MGIESFINCSSTVPSRIKFGVLRTPFSKLQVGAMIKLRFFRGPFTVMVVRKNQKTHSPNGGFTVIHRMESRVLFGISWKICISFSPSQLGITKIPSSSQSDDRWWFHHARVNRRVCKGEEGEACCFLGGCYIHPRVH